MLFESFYIIFILFLTGQAFVSLYLSLYYWDSKFEKKTAKQANGQDQILTNLVRFSLIVPVRHEEKVIGDTLKSLSRLDYPSSHYEVLVVCHKDDAKTINAAKKVIASRQLDNFSVITFAGTPINKPRGLNVGLARSKYPFVGIFDAEDEVAVDLLKRISREFNDKQTAVVQSGVQLMNYQTKWFSALNVLEYYFWFKSRLKFHQEIGMVPLGGNTVFFRKAMLQAVGGWDEAILTEDADVGVRLTQQGYVTKVLYDPSLVTKEETPATVWQFIRQRSRWNQGFIQVLLKGDWLGYANWKQKLLALYTLTFPLVQAVLFLVAPVFFVIGAVVKTSILVSLLSFVPILLLMLMVTVNMLALAEFVAEQKLKLYWRAFAGVLLWFVPFQMLLGVAAVRASYRVMLRRLDWEKTMHHGNHRELAVQLAVNQDN